MSRNRRKGNRPDYEVGYAKPPAHTRFQPGRSGNPKGRPRKVQTQESPLGQFFSQRIPIALDGKKTTVPASEAVLQKLLQVALSKDNTHAIGILIKLIMAQQTHQEKPPVAEEDVNPDDEGVIVRYLQRQASIADGSGTAPAGGGDE